MFSMVKDVFYEKDEDTFMKTYNRIEKYENISDHMEIEIQAKGGNKSGRNKSPSLIANIPILDLQKTAKIP